MADDGLVARLGACLTAPGEMVRPRGIVGVHEPGIGVTMATRETSRTQGAARARAASAGGPPKDPVTPTSITPLGQGSEVARPGYVVPVLHVHLPERVVNAGFWGTLVGSAALGMVDLPLAALIGGAVYVARHHSRPGN
jgi:hypothetical protein